MKDITNTCLDVVRIWISPLEVYCYGFDWNGLYLVLFGFVTEDPAKGKEFFKPNDQRAILLLDELPSATVRCATVDISQDPEWKACRPRFYQEKPDPIGLSHGIERYLVYLGDGKREFLSKEEVEEGGFWPRVSLESESYEGQLAEIVRDWPRRTVGQASLDADQGAPGRISSKDDLSNFATVRFSVDNGSLEGEPRQHLPGQHPHRRGWGAVIQRLPASRELLPNAWIKAQGGPARSDDTGVA